MRYETTKRIDASPAVVWRLLSDVERWPEWMPTMTSVELDRPRLDLGATATVVQPRRGPVRYRVDTLEDGRRFRWTSRGYGVQQWADHVVDTDGDGSSTVTLSFVMSGPTGSLLGALAAGRVRDYLNTEAASLKQTAEQSTTP